MNIEVIRYRLPVYWVGALINDDWTGLSDEEAQKVDGVDVYYDQISEVVYLAKVILEEMEEKDHGESS